MKHIIITILGILIIGCSNSPEKLMEKGDEYAASSAYGKAIETYSKIADKFPLDTLAIKAKYKLAWINLDKLKNYSYGFDMLKSISTDSSGLEVVGAARSDINNFTQWLIDKTTQLRTDSLYKDALNTVDYLLTNFEDSSLLPEALYLKGNIYLNDTKEYYRAITTYQEVIYKYKGTNYEPMSKFMIGYIYANVQGQYVKAEQTYNEFLKEFPEHELVPSVKFELEYLGRQIKNIEDLKKRNN